MKNGARRLQPGCTRRRGSLVATGRTPAERGEVGDGEREGGRRARISRREGPIGERHVLVDYLILTFNVGSCTLIERAKTREVGWVSIGKYPTGTWW